MYIVLQDWLVIESITAAAETIENSHHTLSGRRTSTPESAAVYGRLWPVLCKHPQLDVRASAALLPCMVTPV